MFITFISTWITAGAIAGFVTKNYIDLVDSVAEGKETANKINEKIDEFNDNCDLIEKCRKDLDNVEDPEIRSEIIDEHNQLIEMNEEIESDIDDLIAEVMPTEEKAKEKNDAFIRLSNVTVGVTSIVDLSLGVVKACEIGSSLALGTLTVATAGAGLALVGAQYLVSLGMSRLIARTVPVILNMQLNKVTTKLQEINA